MLSVLHVIHVIIAALPWIIALFVRSPAILLAAIAIQTLVILQWVVVGHCLLNPLENNGSIHSIATEKLATWMKIPFEEFNKISVMVSTASPSFLQLSRLAGSLGL
jgi:hypothetical protein